MNVDNAETQLQVLNANIEADQGTLQNLKDNREALKNEKDEYRVKGKRFWLPLVRKPADWKQKIRLTRLLGH